MRKARKIFAVHPGEILKTEFMEPMCLTNYALAKALNFRGIYEVVRGDRAVSADTAIRLGKYFRLPAQCWLNLQTTLISELPQAVESARGSRAITSPVAPNLQEHGRSEQPVSAAILVAPGGPS